MTTNDTNGVRLVLAPDETGTWFRFIDEGVRLKIRDAQPSRVRALRVAAGLPEWAPAKETLTKEQSLAYDVELLDWTIEDWEGIVGSDGVALPPTRENKLLLAASHGALIEEKLPVWRQAAYANRAFVRAQDLGNSTGSSGGESSTLATPAAEPATTRGAAARKRRSSKR